MRGLDVGVEARRPGAEVEHADLAQLGQVVSVWYTVLSETFGISRRDLS